MAPQRDDDATPLLCAVTGVTGYVGGRLVPVRLEAGYRVRASARNPVRVRDLAWIEDV